MLQQKPQNPISIYRSRERRYKVQAVKVGEKFKMLLFNITDRKNLFISFFFLWQALRKCLAAKSI